MSFYIVKGTLAADVANAGTFTVSYPTGTNLGTFTGSVNHKLGINQAANYSAPVDFSLTFGSSNITVTNNTSSTWLNGSSFTLQVEQVGETIFNDGGNVAVKPEGVAVAPKMVLVSLGAPATASSTALVASQSLAAASTTGATLVTNTLDGAAGRNVVAAWTGTAVLTVSGTDVYGNAITESSASGTSFTGAKAFKTVTKITVSADVTGLTAGTGTVLGLPVFLTNTGYVIKELVDGAVAGTAGTYVKGITAASTATTGDVRGTYAPNSAPNGSRSYQAIIACPDVSYLGTKQFAA